MRNAGGSNTIKRVPCTYNLSQVPKDDKEGLPDIVIHVLEKQLWSYSSYSKMNLGT